MNTLNYVIENTLIGAAFTLLGADRLSEKSNRINPVSNTSLSSLHKGLISKAITRPSNQIRFVEVRGKRGINTLNSKDIALFNNEVKPVAVYTNADLQKELIIKQNIGKIGVYRWTNKLSGKSYVGSSAYLNKRLSNYFSYNILAKNKNVVIYKALLKYGYSNFMVEILEYTDKLCLLEREQYYIDLLKPQYNILKKAGSSLGFKHSEATLKKFRAKKFTPEQLEKVKMHLKELNSKPFSPEIRAKISQGMANFNIKTKGKKIVFTNIETQEILTFVSMRDAALNMKISRNTISKYLMSQEVWGKYKISLL